MGRVSNGTTRDDKGIEARESLMAYAETAAVLQAVLAVVALVLSTTSQTLAVAASAMACALSLLSVLSVVAAFRIGRRDGTSEDGRGRLIIDAVLAVAVSAACLFAFFPRFGQFADKNPYSNKEVYRCTAVFVVGREFVVPGSIQTDGLVVRAAEGEEIDPPTVLPKPGLTFIGWRYAGTGDPDIAVDTPIYLDANGTKNNSVVLYAEFVDAQGNAYCACGAMEEGLFSGATWQGLNVKHFLIAFVPVALASIAGVALLSRSGDEDDDDDDDDDAGFRMRRPEGDEDGDAERDETATDVPTDDTDDSVSDEVSDDDEGPSDEPEVEAPSEDANDGGACAEDEEVPLSQGEAEGSKKPGDDGDDAPNEG